MDFKDWFCLNNRESFTIDPKVIPSDAQFYFGRKPLEERMLKQMGRAFIDPRVPKMMLWGRLRVWQDPDPLLPRTLSNP
jgi:hypothetical protein